jgi:hypothetical protein
MKRAAPPYLSEGTESGRASGLWIGLRVSRPACPPSGTNRNAVAAVRAFTGLQGHLEGRAAGRCGATAAARTLIAKSRRLSP